MDKQLPLKNERGFINIGSHPSNDIVIEGENVQPFHMMLDFRQDPYRLLPLSPDSQIWVNDTAVAGREPISIGRDDTILLSSHSLKIIPPTDGEPPSLSISNLSVSSGVVDVGYKQPTMPAEQLKIQPTIQPPIPAVPPLKPGVDIKDEVIVASLAEDSAVINVEQSAYFTLKVANGSTIVSTFNVRVDGVPDEWVVVNPQNVNLNEGGRAEINITITPPRRPTSKAGKYPLRFIIASLNHPGRQTVLNASLEINPYYDFAISDLQPGRKSIGWSQSSGNVKMKVVNRGNNSSAFLLTARDEEEGCRFQFMGEDGLKQTGQVQLTIQPGEERPIPVYVSPIKRRLVSFNSPQYSYRVAATQPQNAALTLFSPGTIIARPLINIWGVLLILACIAATIGYLFTPRIGNFSVEDNAVGIGGSTTLHWKVPIFTHDLHITDVTEPINTAQGSLVVYPKNTVNTYTFNATTWLWTMLGLKPLSRSVTVLALPGEPTINTFTINQTDNVLQGDQVLVRWSVENATKVQLTINGVTEVFEDKSGFNGEKTLLVTKDTLIYLEASNPLGSIARSKFFKASPPDIKIVRFETSKKTLYIGDQITIYWEVTGAGMDNGGQVTISGFEGVLPNKGELTFFPKASMEFVLTATNRHLRESRILPVGVLEKEAAPPPPVIDFFTAAPNTIVGPGKVELSWSVSGIFDNIKVFNGNQVIADNLSAQGFNTISVSTSGTYVLTATYGSKSVGANLQITVNPGLITPNLKITNVFPSVNVQMGDTATVTIQIGSAGSTAFISSFKNAAPVASPPPTGTVIVSDGSASCTITLPKNSCDMVFQTAGLKQIVATYQGDSNYTSAEAKYKNAINVGVISCTLNAVLRDPNNTTNTKFGYGERLDLAVNLLGIKQNFKPNGTVKITKYICDANKLNCVLATDQPAEFSHTFSPQDNGIYNFANFLLVDRINNTIQLQVVFSGDSFYNSSSATLDIFVDPSSASPVTITSVQPDPKVFTYDITVTDENVYGYYSVPKGTVTFTATNTDGTRASCTAVALTPNTDKRSSTMSCDIMPTERGLWTLSASYIPTGDTTHLAQSSTMGSFTATAVVFIALAGDSPVLKTGVSSQMKVNVTDSMGKVLGQGTLVYLYNGGTKSCIFIGAEWLCDAIKPVPVDNLPIIFNFTPSPSDSAYLTPQTQPYYNLVQAADTVASGFTAINATIAPPPYLPGTDYTFRVNVSSAEVGGDPPASGTVSVKLINKTGKCTDTSTREFDMTVGANGVATGDFTFQPGDSGKTLCYQFDGVKPSTTYYYNPSDWITITNLNVQNLSTAVSGFALQGGATFPPTGGVVLGNSYTFIAVVSETSGKGTPIPSGSTVTVKLVDSTTDGTNCAGASSLFSAPYSLVVGSNGNAVGSAVTFPDTLILTDQYILCYQYDGSGILGASPWAWTSTFNARKRKTQVSSFAPQTPPASPGSFVLGTSYSFTATVSDNEGGTPITPTGGQINISLASGSATDCNGTLTSLGSINVTNGSASGSLTFSNSDANGSSWKFCYQYTGSGIFNSSSWGITTTAFYVKKQTAFTTIPTSQSIAVVQDVSKSANRTTTLTVKMTEYYSIDTSKLKLVDASNNIICEADKYLPTSSSWWYCEAPTVTYSNPKDDGTVTVTWKIAFNKATHLTITPVFDGDTQNLPVTSSTTFDIDARYNVIWADAVWESASNVLAAYISGELGSTTGTFYGTYYFDKFSDYDYAAITDFSYSMIPAANIVQTLSCVVTKVWSSSLNINVAKVRCDGVGITDATVQTVNVQIAPIAHSDDYTGSYTSPNISVFVRGNIVQKDGGPTVTLGCGGWDGNSVKFTIDGVATKPRSGGDLSSYFNNMTVVMGCDLSGNLTLPYHEWYIYNTSNSTYNLVSYDVNTGQFELTITASIDTKDDPHYWRSGCDFYYGYHYNVNPLRVAIYDGYAYQVPASQNLNPSATSDSLYNPSGTAAYDNSVYWEYFWDLRPIWTHDWQGCATGFKGNPPDNP